MIAKTLSLLIAGCLTVVGLVMAAAAETPAADSRESYRKFAQASPSDRERGRLVFETKALGCVTCHAQPGDGGSVGPDLKGVGSRRSTDYLLDAILEPSKDIVPGFGTTTVETADGKTVSGTFLGEDERALTIRDEAGREHRIPKSSIQARNASSPMPDGLHAQMSRQQFADLIAYLKSLK